MYKGIIYKYSITFVNGKEKCYIGQTCFEKQRRQDFLNKNVPYSGKRIDNARRKYGPENFKYEIIVIVICKTNEDRSELLNKLEMFYITLFDSFHNGYNNTIGGGGTNGYSHTLEYKKWQSEKSRELAKDPEYRKKISTGIIAHYENNPEARTIKSEETKKRYMDPLERYKTSLVHKKSYADNPERAKKQAKKLSQTCSTLEGRKRMSETIKKAWETEEYREKYLKSKKALWATKEYREKMAVAYKDMNGKRVLQLTLDGSPIKQYCSATDAARQLDYNFGSICRVCRGERQHYKGYKWMYIKEQ